MTEASGVELILRSPASHGVLSNRGSRLDGYLYEEVGIPHVHVRYDLTPDSIDSDS